MPGEAIVGAIAITLDRTAKVDRDKFIQTLRLSSRVPLEEHIFTRSMPYPQVTQACLSIAGIEISDGCLIVSVRLTSSCATRSLRRVRRIQVPEKQATRPKRRLLRERNFQVLRRHLLKSVCLLAEKRFVQRLAVLRSAIKEDIPNSFFED
jgi:hypothetical protein